MKQVIQNFKTGKWFVDYLTSQAISEGMVLFANAFSLISAGTERSTAKVAKVNLLGKAKQRPDLVIQLLQNVTKERVNATYEKVRVKPEALNPLGVITPGVVLVSRDTNGLFKPESPISFKIRFSLATGLPQRIEL